MKCFRGMTDTLRTKFCRSFETNAARAQDRLTTGASLGAYLAANTYFKHSDNFRGTIAMSGSYDIYNYLDKGYYDDNVYFNNPNDVSAAFERRLSSSAAARSRFDRYRNGTRVVRSSEQKPRSFTNPQSKGIPHLLDVWGHDVEHDWVWWRKMLPHFLDKFVN